MALAAAIFLLTRGDDGGEDTAPAANATATEAWSQAAAEAYAPLGDTTLRLPGRVREWLEGSRPTEQLRTDLAEALTATTEVRDRVSRLPAFPHAGDVTPLYRASSELYVEQVRVYQEALGAPPDTRAQLDLVARRLRVLGDRVFDRGQALVKPHLPEQSSPDVVVNLPEDVPNWAAEGLAAGPPLASPPAPPSGPPPLREETRPTQPRNAWLAAVREALPPPGAPAEQLEAAAERLRNVPDPDTPDGREESARLRLALLIRAEAARIDKAAALFGLPAMSDVARRVAGVEPLVAPAG